MNHAEIARIADFLANQHIAITPIGIQNSATATVTTATALSIPVPTGTVNGQPMVMVAYYNLAATASITTPSGWTALFNGSGTGSAVLYAYRVASSEPASYSVATNNNTRINNGAGAIVTFTHANSTTPIDGTSVHLGGTSASSITTGSYTPTLSTDAIIACFCASSGSPHTISSPFTSIVSAVAGTAATLDIAYYIPGNTSTRTATDTLSATATIIDSVIFGLEHA